LTERKRADEEREHLIRELMKTNKDLQALTRVTDAVLTTLDLQGLLDALLE